MLIILCMFTPSNNKTTMTPEQKVYQVIVGGLIEMETLVYQEAKNRMNLLKTMGFDYKFTYRFIDESEC